LEEEEGKKKKKVKVDFGVGCACVSIDFASLIKTVTHSFLKASKKEHFCSFSIFF